MSNSVRETDDLSAASPLSTRRGLKRRSREWQPFVVRPGPDESRIARNLRKGGEKAKLWPTKLARRNYRLIIYSRSWYPLRFRPTAYVALDQKQRVIGDFETCSKVVATFRVWSIVYFHPIRKHSRLPRKWVRPRRNKLLALIYENCKQRLAEDEYEKTEDPALLQLNRTIRELDKNVVDSYELIRKHQLLLDRAADEEKEIWADPSFEKVEAYADRLLPQVKRSDDAMVSYDSGIESL